MASKKAMRSTPSAHKSKFVVLNDDDEEYISVKQYLSSCLLSQGKVTEVKMVKIDNDDLTQRFDKRSRNLIKLVGWSNLKSLSADNNDLSLLGSRGFVVSKGSTGIDFSVGNITTVSAIHVHNASHGNVELHEPEHTFVYSDIAVGRSYVLDKDWQHIPVPQTYDSFYMPAHQLDQNNDGEFDLFEYQAAASFDDRDPAEYHHKYFIKDMSQCLPKYIIKFKFKQDDDKATAGSTQEAATYADKMSLQSSTLDDYSHFDPETHKPVTMRNKMKHGGAKLLLPIELAYEQALDDWHREDPLIKGKKEWLEDQLDVIDDRVREVNLNYADVLERINATAAAATVELQEITKKKLDILLSAEVELRRQKEQMTWMEGLVSKNFNSVNKKIDAAHRITGAAHEDEKHNDNNETKSNNLQDYSPYDLRRAQLAVTDGQLEFLQIWKHHMTFRNASTRLKPQAHVEALNSVKPDIAVKTDLHVYIDNGKDRSNTGINTPTDNERGTSSRVGIIASEHDKINITNISNSMQLENNYSQPARPARDLISHLLQSVIDVEAGRIHDALNSVLRDDSKVPLPASFHRPPTAGKNYASSQLLDILTPSNIKPNNSEAINHKELYYDSMKYSLGHAPNGAKELKKTSGHHHHHHHHHNDNTKQSNKMSAKHQQPVPSNVIPHVPADPNDANKQQKQQKEEEDFKKVERDRNNFLQSQQEFQHDQMIKVQKKRDDEILKQQMMKQQAIFEKEKTMREERALQQKNPFIKRNNDIVPDSNQSQSTYSSSKTHSLYNNKTQVALGSSLTGPGMQRMTATTQSTVTKTSRAGSINSAVSQSVNGKIFSGEHQHKKFNGTGMSFSKDALFNLAKKFHAGFSFHNNSSRRIAQLRTDENKSAAADAIEEFSLSEILDLDDARMIYYSLPFFSKPPAVHIMYSSAEATGDGTQVHLEDLYTKCMTSDKPSVIIIKAGEFTFGCYLSHPIRVMNSGWTGSPSCFLFSCTLDLKLPYHARNPPVHPGNTSNNKPVAFKAERDKLTIGNGDLIIHDGGLCESRLENCYGVGLTSGSSEANCALGGATEFVVDEMEIWTIG